MTDLFDGFDFSNFWDDCDYAWEEYVEAPPSEDLISSIESELGFRLPQSYIHLMQIQNGGIPIDTNYPCETPTSWADDHVAITGIMGIGREKTYSLCGPMGSTFMQEEWGYPDFGICVCDCPSAGHDMIMLDYRECGPDGEPAVVHVDQESDFKVTFLAPNFEIFIRGLVNESVFDTSDEDLKECLQKIDNGSLSTQLRQLIEACDDSGFEKIIRNVCRQVATTKGYFAFHDDDLSYLIYDIQFFLYSSAHAITEESFLEAYPSLIALSDGDLTTGGYGAYFVADWLHSRLKKGQITEETDKTLLFSDAYQADFFDKIAEFR